MASKKKTLKGKTVVLTRSREGNEVSRALFEDAGARVLEIPLIEIEHTHAESDECLETISEYDWIVFTSGNGVRGFFGRFFKKFEDIREIGPAKFACVGPATEGELKQFHLSVDVSTSGGDAEALARGMMEFESLDNLKILVITGNRNRDTLVNLLTDDARAIVDIMPVYTTSENDISDCKDAQAFREQGAHAIVFASPSAVDSFVAQAKELRIAADAQKPLTVAIGPTTASAMRKAGIPVQVQGDQFTMQGVLEALLEQIGA